MRSCLLACAVLCDVCSPIVAYFTQRVQATSLARVACQECSQYLCSSAHPECQPTGRPTGSVLHPRHARSEGMRLDIVSNSAPFCTPCSPAIYALRLLCDSHLFVNAVTPHRSPPVATEASRRASAVVGTMPPPSSGRRAAAAALWRRFGVRIFVGFAPTAHLRQTYAERGGGDGK